MVSLLEQINKHFPQDVAVDLGDAFFLIFAPKDSEKQIAFSWQGCQYTFTGVPQGYINSLASVIT